MARTRNATGLAVMRRDLQRRRESACRCSSWETGRVGKAREDEAEEEIFGGRRQWTRREIGFMARWRWKEGILLNLNSFDTSCASDATFISKRL